MLNRADSIPRINTGLRVSREPRVRRRVSTEIRSRFDAHSGELTLLDSLRVGAGERDTDAVGLSMLIGLEFLSLGCLRDEDEERHMSLSSNSRGEEISP